MVMFHTLYVQFDISFTGLPINIGSTETQNVIKRYEYRTFNRQNHIQLLQFQAVCLRVIYLVVVTDSHTLYHIR